MKTIFVSWLGNNDFACLSEKDPTHLGGGVAKAVQDYSNLFAEAPDTIQVLSSWGSYDKDLDCEISLEYQQDRVQQYMKRLQTSTEVPIESQLFHLTNPTDYSAIYIIVSEALEIIARKNNDDSIRFVFYISSGTGSMQAIWLLLSKTEYPGTILVKASVEAGFEKVDFPFDIAVKNQSFYGGDATFQNLTPKSLTKIRWKSTEMFETLKLAGNIAHHDDMRVLIQGETGSGKELFARLIHDNSRRHDKAFETVNCGAIPENLIESELFGHKKGAFTGADQDKKGLFKLADGGTLFLDEIGELPLAQQVKLLRMTDRHQQKFKPVGGEENITVDVRIIAATHRNLMEHVAEGSFREDLFYRLCDAPLKLPPLRERQGDIECLAHHFVTEINRKSEEEKTLAKEAVQFIKSQSWPGNVRELEATVSRAYKLYATGAVITRNDLEKSLISSPAKAAEEIFTGKAFDDEFNMDEMLLMLRVHYIVRAIRQVEKLTATEVAGLLNMKPGTLTKQLREKKSLTDLLLKSPEGEKFLATILRK